MIEDRRKLLRSFIEIGRIVRDVIMWELGDRDFL